MEKEELEGYIEFTAHLADFRMESELKDLIEAADISQVHTFGWPVGVVLHTGANSPKPYTVKGETRGIRAIIDSSGRFDYWTLNKNGDYYILSSLFEDQRSKNKIFIDTRTVRITETFWRTGRLYKQLHVPLKSTVECRLEHGGLLNRELTAANHLRAFTVAYNRKSSAKFVAKNFQLKVEDLLELESLQSIVHSALKSLTEVFEMFIPSKEQFTDPIVDAYLNGKII